MQRGAVPGDDDLSLESSALAGMHPEAAVPRKASIPREEWGWRGAEQVQLKPAPSKAWLELAEHCKTMEWFGLDETLNLSCSIPVPRAGNLPVAQGAGLCLFH